jgi:hypothetical protein
MFRPTESQYIARLLEVGTAQAADGAPEPVVITRYPDPPEPLDAAVIRP